MSIMRVLKIKAQTIAAVSLVIGVSFILSTGGYIQLYTFSLIDTDYSTIYGSAYKEAIASFPKLSEWILGGFSWQYLSMSAIIIAYSLRSKTPRHIFFHSLFSSFVALLIFDVLHGLYSGNLSSSYILQNVVANFIGGIIIAFIIIMIIQAGDFCFMYNPYTGFLRYIPTILCPAALGIFISASVYYIFDTLYRPIPIKLDAYFDQPISGIILERNSNNPTGSPSATDRPFRLIDSVEQGSAQWRSPGGELKGKWRAAQDSAIFDVAIQLFTGCPERAGPDRRISSPQTLSISDIKEIDVWFDQGMSQISNIDTDLSRYSIDVNIDGPSFYSIDKFGVDKFAINQFARYKSELKYSISGDQFKFYVNAPLLVGKGDGIIDGSRTLNIRIDQSNYTIKFVPSGNNNSDSTAPCRGLATNDVFKRARLASSISVSDIGVLIDVRRRKLPKSQSTDKNSYLTLTGGEGWIDVNNIDDNELNENQGGSIGMMSFRGNVSRLSLDGIPESTHAFETDIAVGDLNATFEKSGILNLSGTANAIWKEGSRKNPTKWERLSWEPKGLIATLLGMIFIFFSGLSVRILRRNADVISIGV